MTTKRSSENFADETCFFEKVGKILSDSKYSEKRDRNLK